LVNGSTCSGICLATIDAGLDFAYGRATLVNNYGSANEPLLLPFSTQFFDGQDWRINANDSCTAYDHIGVNDASNGLATENSGTLAQGSYVSGEGIRITSPNGEGEFFVTFDTPPWLLWDWSNNDVADEPPSATLTFGVYRGNDNIIYKREKIGN
jgi:MSHA biogenesis protein MshQ